MSYILDALKKSEQERAEKNPQDSGAAFESHIAPRVVSNEPSLKGVDNPWLVKLLYVGLIILAVWVLVKIFDANEPLITEVIDPEQVSEQVSEPVPVPEPVSESAPINTSPVVIELAMPIEQASVDLVKDIPALSITSHIYSTQAKRRSIVVNNNRLIEGGYISAGVRVYSITNTGMVIDAHGQLLTVNRSRGWDAK